MHVAALKGDYKVIKLLLLFGANPYLTTNSDKYTPLDLSKLKNKTKCIEVLEPLYYENNYNRIRDSENNQLDNYKKAHNSNFSKSVEKPKLTTNIINSDISRINDKEFKDNISPKKYLFKSADVNFAEKDKNKFTKIQNFLSSENNTENYNDNEIPCNIDKQLSSNENIGINNNNYFNIVKNFSFDENYSASNIQCNDSSPCGFLTTKNSNYKLNMVKNNIDFQQAPQMPNNNLSSKNSRAPIDKKLHNRTHSAIDKRKRDPSTNYNNSSFTNKASSEGNNSIRKEKRSCKFRKLSNGIQDNQNKSRSKEKNSIDSKPIAYETGRSSIGSSRKNEYLEFDSFRKDSNFNYLPAERANLSLEKSGSNLTTNNELIENLEILKNINENTNKYFNKNINNIANYCDNNISNNNSSNKKKNDGNIFKKYESENIDFNNINNILLRESSKDSNNSNKIFNNDNLSSNLNDDFYIDRTDTPTIIENINNNNNKNINTNINSNETSFRESSSFMKNMNNFEERLEKMKIDFIKTSTEKGKGLATNFENFVSQFVKENPNNNNKNNKNFTSKSQNFFINTCSNRLNSISEEEGNSNNKNILSSNSSNAIAKVNKTLNINELEPLSAEILFNNNTMKNNSHTNANFGNLNLGLNIKLDVVTPAQNIIGMETSLTENNRKILDAIVNIKKQNIETYESVEIEKNKEVHQTPNFSEIDGKRKDFINNLENIQGKYSTQDISSRALRAKQLNRDFETNNNIDDDNNPQNENNLNKLESPSNNAGFHILSGTTNERSRFRNFSLFNNIINNNKDEEEDNSINAAIANKNYKDENNLNSNQKINYNNTLNGDQSDSNKVNVNLNKLSFKYLNININKNRRISSNSNLASEPKPDEYEDNRINEVEVEADVNKDFLHNNNNEGNINHLKEDCRITNTSNTAKVSSRENFYPGQSSASNNIRRISQVESSDTANSFLTQKPVIFSNYKKNSNYNPSQNFNRYPSTLSSKSNQENSKISEFEINKVNITDENQSSYLNNENLEYADYDNLQQQNNSNFRQSDFSYKNSLYDNSNRNINTQNSYDKQIKNKIDKSLTNIPRSDTMKSSKAAKQITSISEPRDINTSYNYNSKSKHNSNTNNEYLQNFTLSNNYESFPRDKDLNANNLENNFNYNSRNKNNKNNNQNLSNKMQNNFSNNYNNYNMSSNSFSEKNGYNNYLLEENLNQVNYQKISYSEFNNNLNENYENDKDEIDNENPILSIEPAEYLDTQDNKSTNTRITYDSTINPPKNLEDDFHGNGNCNSAYKNKNNNNSYISSKVNDYYWVNMENNREIANIHTGTKSKNKSICNYPNTNKNKDYSHKIINEEIHSFRNNYNNNIDSTRNLGSGYLTCRNNYGHNSTRKTNDKYRANGLKETFVEKAKELAVFFSSKNGLGSNKKLLLKSNEIKRTLRIDSSAKKSNHDNSYERDTYKHSNNMYNYSIARSNTYNEKNINNINSNKNNNFYEDENLSNDANNISNGNLNQQQSRNGEETGKVNANKMIQKRKIKYFSKTNKSLKEEFKQISLDTQALEETIKKIPDNRINYNNNYASSNSNFNNIYTNVINLFFIVLKIFSAY